MTRDELESLLGAEVVSVRRFEPWFVWRVELAEQGPVIVKRLRDDPNGFRTSPTQVLTERASLEFLADLHLAVAPRLLAAPAHAPTVLVLEDLSPRVPLWDLLRTSHAETAENLRAFAAIMGRLHAGTSGQADLFRRRRAALGPVPDDSPAWTLPELGDIGVRVGGSVEVDLAVARQTLRQTGPFLAMSNGDAGANNFLVDCGDGRIVDWEFGQFRHALLDAACLYVPGPMWMTVADPSTSGADDAYRRALVEGVPAAGDDRAYGLGMAAACLVTAIERLTRFARLDRRPAGHESRAQMVSTLEAAARTAHRFESLPHLAGWVQTTAAALRRRWPDADHHYSDAYTTRE